MTVRMIIGCLTALVLLVGAGAAHALTVTDMLGRAVQVPERPLRLVSLAPSLTETVFALGRGDWLVGVTDQCDYPGAARQKPRVGGMGAPDLERIVLARPDLVLVTAEANAREMVVQLDRLGIESFAVTPSSFAGIRAAIRRVARVLQAEAAGAAVVGAMAQRVDAMRDRVGQRPRPRTLFLIWTDPLIAAGRHTFLHDLIGLAGGVDVARGAAPYPRLGWEEMLAAAPDVILVALHRGGSAAAVERALVEAWRPWRAVPAIRAGAIVPVPADIVLRPGPRVTEGLAYLARALHPEVFGGWR